MCDNSPINGLEETNRDQAKYFGDLLSLTTDADLCARPDLTSTFRTSRSVRDQVGSENNDLGLLRDDLTSTFRSSKCARDQVGTAINDLSLPRDDLTSTFRSSKCARDQVGSENNDLGLLSDGDSSCRLDGVIQATNESSVSRSDCWAARSQHAQSLVGAQQCVVCGEVANGNFFGAVVCLPCKSFFIRCTKGGEPCILQQCYGSCDIKKQFRNRCQFCRYQQCLTMGMSRKEKPECIHPQEGQELCKVCGDLANGIHFGVNTCEGCKKFFRRGLKEHQSYICKDNGNCALNPRNRNNCRSCRYRMCVKVGMSREAIKMGRPRKVYQNDTETTARSPEGDSNIGPDSQSASCYDDRKEVVVKLEFEEEFSVEGGRELENSGTWFQGSRLQAKASRRGSDSSQGLPKHQQADTMTLQAQQRDHSFRSRELLRACSSPDCRHDNTYRELLHPESCHPSLVHRRPLSRQTLERASPEIRTHKPYLPTRSASQRPGHDPLELSERIRHQQRRRPDTCLSETTSRSMHRLPEKRLHAQSKSPDCKQRLLQGPQFDIANVDRQVSARLNGIVNLAGFPYAHLDESASVSSQILSHYSVENYAHHLSESRLSPLRSTSKSHVSESKTDQTIDDRLLDEYSETVKYVTSQEPNSHWPRSYHEESREVYHKSRLNHSLEQQLMDDAPRDKETKYDDGLILDLSLNTKTHLVDDNGRIKTSSVAYSNGRTGSSCYDSQNNRTWTNHEHDTQSREPTKQYLTHETSQQSVYDKPHNGSSTYIQSVGKFRKCLPPSSIVSSYDKTKCIDGTRLKADNSPVSKTPLHEIANNYTHTGRSTYRGTIPSPEIKSEISYSREETFPALTRIGDHRARGHQVGSEFESGIVKREPDCWSYSSTPVLSDVLSSSDGSFSSNSGPYTSIYNNNNNNNNKSNNNTSICEYLNSTSSFLSSRRELSTKTFSASVSPNAEKHLPSPLVIARSLPLIDDRLPESHFIINSGAEQRESRKLGPCTNDQTVMYINEMFMVADTFTDTLSGFSQRASGDRISSELTAVDGMFTDVYGYSPIKVTHFWKNLHFSMPGLSSNKWRDVLTTAQVGWLTDVTQSYSELVRACEDGANRSDRAHDLLTLLGEEVDQCGHYLELLTRQTHEQAQFVRSLPDIDKIHPKDRVKLGNSTRLFGNTILMASREWFDPVRKKFKLFWNWTISKNHLLYPFQNRMIRIGSLICNLHLDRTEVAILSALNVVGPEDGTFHTLSQISGHTEIFIKVLGHYLYTINVDPNDRIPELLSVMPKVRLMTMWYSNLIKNMGDNTSSMDTTLQDLPLMTTKMSSRDVIAR